MGLLEPSLRSTDLILYPHHLEEERRQGPKQARENPPKPTQESWGQSRLKAKPDAQPRGVPRLGLDFWMFPVTAQVHPTHITTLVFLLEPCELARNSQREFISSMLHTEN